LANDPDTFAELKVKEIKNGRLAMVAILGFYFATFQEMEAPAEEQTPYVAPADEVTKSNPLLVVLKDPAKARKLTTVTPPPNNPNA
jgi:hypothetical protein